MLDSPIEKVCFKCRQCKPIAEFYRHPDMADGVLGKCKACTRVDVTRHRLLHIDRVREAERLRPRDASKMVARKRAWNQRYPERMRAHNIAARAKLVGPKRCERCRSDRRRLEKHHTDYSRPLVVEWLCKPCHYLADELRRSREAG
jgi:hypothetical protein